MKTAISMKDELLQQADETAKSMGLSRSGLFALAVTDFLKRERQEKIMKQLNEVYADGPTPEEKRLVKGMKSKARRVFKDPW